MEVRLQYHHVMIHDVTQQTFCREPAAAPTLASAGPTAGAPQNVCWVTSGEPNYEQWYNMPVICVSLNNVH